ncbi:MAG: carbohydrate kinase family protein [Gammaproteobacteria bacterium]|jgi:adenosine kinase
MSALICGSFAYDSIMVFPGRFADQILPNQIHMLNVAFLVPEMRREFGGCAGNIVYNLRLLGGEGHAMGAVGSDFAPYADWMDRHELSRRYLHAVPEAYTAQAYITTDMDDNQITAFHPGAMNHAHEIDVPEDAGISWGMVSPDGRDAMLLHARQFADAGIPFVFDPGQGLPMFDGDELVRFLDLASVVTVNDYEGQMLQERTGLTAEQISSRVQAYVVTRGVQGSVIIRDGDVLEVPPARPMQVVDPTGCGDAYRAGLLFGLLAGADWEITGRVASLMGAIKVGSPGTQNHSASRQSLGKAYEENFGQDPGLW